MPFRRNPETEDRADDANDDSAPERGPKAVYMDTLHQPGDQFKQESVDDYREQPKREKNERDGNHVQDGPNNGIEQREENGRRNAGSHRVHPNAGNHIPGQKDGDPGDAKADEETLHMTLFVKRYPLIVNSRT